MAAVNMAANKWPINRLARHHNISAENTGVAQWLMLLKIMRNAAAVNAMAENNENTC
jgi:hypothetical protein